MTSPEKPPLTDAEYVAAGGGACPFCGSSNITGGFVNIEGREASQPVDCQDCEAEWVDIYNLTGYVKS